MFFFFNDTATTEIYTLSLHDALPILTATRDMPVDELTKLLAFHNISGMPVLDESGALIGIVSEADVIGKEGVTVGDRKSTRLNSSHANISYAVFCLKKKKKYIPLDTS